jgi:vesicle transport through interaction with t-SNAREs 1
MSIFDAYDSEFSALSSDISKNISDFRTYSSSNSGDKLLDISIDKTYYHDDSEFLHSQLITYFYCYVSEKSSNLVKHIDALLAQAGDLVKQMEVEIRSHDAATRKVLSDKIAQYKKSLASLRSDFERARTEADRAKLVGGGGGKSAQDRERFLTANDK